MTTHLSTEQIEKYAGRKSSRAELARVNEHLFGCDDCYNQFLYVFQIRRGFPIEIDLDDLAGLKDWHLQGEELKAYAKGGMDEIHLDHANLHLKACAWCREEVSHFSEFTDKLEYYLSKRHAPLKQPGERSRYFPKVGAIPIAWSPVRLASAAALILALLISATLVWSLLGIEPQQEDATAYESSKQGSNVQADTSPPVQAIDSSEPPQSPQPDTSTDSDHTFDSMEIPGRPNSHVSATHASADRRTEEKAQRDGEASLLAENLVMPRIIEVFDRAPVVLRGDGNKSEAFSVASPYSTLISDDQPTFRWTALNGASSYIVSVYDANLNLIETSEPLSKTQWLIPSRLNRGVVYTWVVAALKEGKEILAPTLPARAEFKVIEQSEWTKLRNLIQNTQSGAARGVLYAKAGLLDDAERELRAHLNHHSADESAIKLLKTIKSWREP